MDWDRLPLAPEEMFGADLAEAFRRPSPTSGGPFQAILLPLRELVVYPQMVSPLYIKRERSLHALSIAMQEDWAVVVVAQRDDALGDGSDDYPTPADLYTVGTEVVIARTIRLPDGTTSAIAQGAGRVRLLEIVQERPYLIGTFEQLSESTEDSALTEALTRAILAMFEKVVQLNPALPEEAYVYAMNVDAPGQLADVIAQIITLSTATRQELLETLEVTRRLQRISALLAKELNLLELEDQIHTTVQEEVDKTQREYFLRERLRAIQQELGEIDGFSRDVAGLHKQIEEAQLPDHVRERAEEELRRLSIMPAMAPEVGIIRTYLEWLLELPWCKETEDNLDILHAEGVLDSRHFGLPKAKQRILEYIAVRKVASARRQSTILCFVGPPGTGKTSLGRSIAEALGREFVRVSLGGVRDEAEIRGHRRTYIGALPGRILQTMRRAGTVNPVFMLDEVDKIGTDFRGDPSSALLEVLDPEQNHAFSDHYLEIAYDLSRVLFIATANILSTIPPALEDRMEVIEFPGYTESEKVEIAKRFLVPRQVEQNGLEKAPPAFSASTLHKLIRQYTYEAGVRNLEREIGSICRKATMRLAAGKPPIRTVSLKSVQRYLGPPRYQEEHVEVESFVGVSMGLAWTPNGGDLLPVEVTLTPGKGTLTLTGQLGDVMQESARAALTYLRSRASAWDIAAETFEKSDIHIHLPEGGIAKDGPSGGITIAAALFSAFTGFPVNRRIAMTGEITLRGRVLPIGGLKEKLLAAHRAGVATVILPARNRKDIQDIPKEIRQQLALVFVDTMDEVLAESLVRAPAQ
jgi:ATP-dependent Lon protease